MSQHTAVSAALALAVLAGPLCGQDAPGRHVSQSPASDIGKEPFLPIGKGWGLDPVIIQPGSHVFFPNDELDEGEIGVFTDGKLAVDLQLFGGDVSRYIRDGALRYGLNVGLGITQLDNANVLLTGASLFLQFGGYYRIDFGYMKGRSGKDGLDSKQRDRSATFVGVSFPTKLNELLRKALGDK